MSIGCVKSSCKHASHLAEMAAIAEARQALVAVMNQLSKGACANAQKKSRGRVGPISSMCCRAQGRGSSCEHRAEASGRAPGRSLLGGSLGETSLSRRLFRACAQKRGKSCACANEWCNAQGSRVRGRQLARRSDARYHRGIGATRTTDRMSEKRAPMIRRTREFAHRTT